MPAPKTATQDFVPIEKIRDGVVVLKSGEYRSVLITSSINLSLKGEDEQQAIFLQFQNLLNSLEYPIQVFVQSRKLDIAPYLTLLEGRKKEIKEDLLRVQIEEYMEFIRQFTSEANIMTKQFFVVVPYFPSGAVAKKQVGSILPFGEQGKSTPSDQGASFEQGRSQLDQRVSSIIQGLSRFGVRAKPLNTEELIELYYRQMNPGEQGGVVKEEDKKEEKILAS